MSHRNVEFLSVIDSKSKALILDAIAVRSGISSEEAYAEVADPEAERLLDYLVEPQRTAALALMQRHGIGLQ
jgi:hypothetical protein